MLKLNSVFKVIKCLKKNLVLNWNRGSGDLRAKNSPSDALNL